VLDLKVKRNQLEQKRRGVAAVVAREEAVARTLAGSGRRREALAALRKKKAQERMLEHVGELLDKVEQLVASIEFAAMQQSVFAALEQGTAALSELNSMLSVDDVERLLGDTQDAVDAAHEIEAALAGALSPADMEHLSDELDALLQLPDEIGKKEKVVKEEKKDPVESVETNREENMKRAHAEFPDVPAGPIAVTGPRSSAQRAQRSTVNAI
jgi:charged multivesicular body protein 6